MHSAHSDSMVGAPPFSAASTTAVHIGKPLQWNDLIHRVRLGIDGCMSRSGEHLKDEVRSVPDA